MRIENIGPDDIQVGDVIAAAGEEFSVTHLLEPGLVVGFTDLGHLVFGWVNDAWRVYGDQHCSPRVAHRDVPDKWERTHPNLVAPAGGFWMFIVDYSIDAVDGGPREAWADDVAAQTAQWLTDRLNEGHFGEMPTFDGEVES